MSTLYRTTGVVLSSRDHREADRWYSVLTQEHGKIEVLGRGARKPLAKLAPHLEMPAVLDLLVVRGRAYDTVVGVERRRAFGAVSGDLARLLLMNNALHLVDIGTRSYEPDPVLYEQIVQWLEFLNTSPAVSPERSGFLLGSFALKLLAIIGYRPVVNRCLGCATAIEPGLYRWHALKGGVVCRSCVDRDNEQWFSARSMGDAALKLVRFALAERFEDQLRPHLPGPVLAEFHEIVESLIISHFPTIPANSLRAACTI